MNALDWIILRKMQLNGISEQNIANTLGLPLYCVCERLEAARLSEMQVVIEPA